MCAIPATEGIESVLLERAGRRWALVLCFAAGILEGLDLQSIGVAAPGIARELHLSATQLGYVGGAGSVGLLFGAICGGMLSDRVGRRGVLIGAVALFGALSLATPLAFDVPTLIFARFVTGLGLGGGLPLIIAIAAEASDPRRRSGTVTMMYSATPIGGIIASSIAYAAGEQWRAIFYFGGIAPLLLVPLLVLRLQETTEFGVAESGDSEAVGVLRALFGRGNTLSTLLLWAGFLGSLLTLYLLLNWLPLLLVSKGFTRAQASLVQVVFNTGARWGRSCSGG